MNNTLEINLAAFTFDQVKESIRTKKILTLSEDAIQSIQRCRNYLDEKLLGADTLFYGINTGFGFLQDVKIDNHQIEQLQYNLLMSHACGMGEYVPENIIRLMLLLKIKSLSYGFSGVQTATVSFLQQMYNHNVLPVVYTQGSLGASGDLAPLSHLSLPIIGMGELWFEGKIQTAAKTFTELNWQPVALKSKEGLALINGTQFMSAYGIYCLAKAESLLKWADIIAAISYDAFSCTLQPLHPLIHSIRKHKGQQQTAETLLKHLAGSEIAQTVKKQVQDPYSFRCIPQVHGASKDVWNNVLNVFLDEINSVTDNPNIFPEEDMILSGGNFHGQPLALHLDFLSIAMSELASISERRTYQLISGQRGLPLFLVKDAGLNSGFMIPQYTAAGMVSENKQLCTPASVDSISSSNNQEDHVSMGANAATKCLRVIENVEKILAIELLSAAQALDFRRPQQSSVLIETIHAELRKRVSFNEKDRVLHDDMMKTIEFMRTCNPDKK
ncbi:MAG: histidine ammonia-lyase [Sphingobacteriia bacterium]|nr:histidine ammonia-lyase [Sphingobacteriia bacterium]